MSLEKKPALKAMGEEEGWLEARLPFLSTPRHICATPAYGCHGYSAPAEVIRDVTALVLAIASGVSGVHVGSTAPGDKSTSAPG